MDNKNLPAFPDPRRGAEQSFTNQAPWDFPQGMTKREYFAAMAMQGWVASHTDQLIVPDVNRVAEFSVQIADALLIELSKPQP